MSRNLRVDQMSDDDLRRESEEKRAEVAADVDALTEKMSRENLKREAIGAARDAKDEMVERTKQEFNAGVHRVEADVRKNPWPYALIAGGIGWMMVDRYVTGHSTPRLDMAKYRARGAVDRAVGTVKSRVRADGSSMPGYEPVGYQPLDSQGIGYEGSMSSDTGSHGRIHEWRERAGARLGNVRSSAGARLGDARTSADVRWQDAKLRAQLKAQDARIAADNARARGMVVARDAGARAQGFYMDNPFAVGGLALALGVGFGLLMPRTQRETAWVGAQSEELQNRARELGRELTSDVTEIAKTTARSTAEAARDAAKETVKSEAKSHHLSDPKAKLGLKSDSTPKTGDSSRSTTAASGGISPMGSTTGTPAAPGAMRPAGITRTDPGIGNGGPSSTPRW